MSTQPLTPFGSALAGALGAVFSNAVVYPLDTVKTRLQALPTSSTQDQPVIASTDVEKGSRHGSVPSGVPAHLVKRLRRFKMLSLLLTIIRTEGPGGVFKGFSANMLNTFSQQFAYFFFHTLLRTRILASRPASPPPRLSTALELFLGALAGALAQIFTIPVAVIATRQQLYTPPRPPIQQPTASQHPNTSSSSTTLPISTQQSSPGFTETAKEIIQESGWTGLWTGLKPGLVLTVNPAITYGVFERLKSAVLAGRAGADARLGVGEAFWLGVGSKTLATVVTYPYIFAKVRLQAKTTDNDDKEDDTTTVSTDAIESTKNQDIDGDEQKTSQSPLIAADKKQNRQRGAIPLLMQVYKQHGFAGWYQGLSAQIVKAVLCQGILFVSKDQFEVYAAIILAIMTRFRQRLFK
ncbi:mitochondrial carrier domain-containing protein [Naematelia encephala]|uniref:Mitochondrial carrier domain-containing protein n=1 Tax=Naematelia encephala TaxID=71784 RepID=A0A1Y2AN80_9TREE|nr:mitochondrial carrier domain-containing protein [Naematelia encephala]